VCGKEEDSHGFGRALRWHTTRRNADDRTAHGEGCVTKATTAVRE